MKMRLFVLSFGWEMLSCHQTHVSYSVKLLMDANMNAKMITYYLLDPPTRSELRARPISTLPETHNFIPETLDPTRCSVNPEPPLPRLSL